jgi:hypothetical protein
MSAIGFRLRDLRRTAGALALLTAIACQRTVSHFAGGPLPVPPVPPVTPTLSVPQVVIAASTGNTASIADPVVGLNYDWQIFNGQVVGNSRGTTVTFTVGEVGAMQFSVNTSNSVGATSTPQEAVASVIAGLDSADTPIIDVPAEVVVGRSGITAWVRNPQSYLTYNWQATGAALLSGASTSGANVTFSVPQAGAGALTVTATIADPHAGGLIATAAITTIDADNRLDIIAGTPSGYGYQDGTAKDARYGSSGWIAADASGNVYVNQNCVIRKVTPDGTVSVLAGAPANCAPIVDGPGNVARFKNPNGLAVDSTGTLYTIDTNAGGNPFVRTIAPDGTVGPFAVSLLNASEIAVDSADNVYVVIANAGILQVNPSHVTTTITTRNFECTDSTTLGAATAYNPTQLSTGGTTVWWQESAWGHLRMFDGVSTVSTFPAGACNASPPLSNILYDASTLVPPYLLASAGDAQPVFLYPLAATTVPSAGRAPSTGMADGTGDAAEILRGAIGTAIPGAAGSLVLLEGGALVKISNASTAHGATLATYSGVPIIVGDVDTAAGDASSAEFGSLDAVAVDFRDNIYVADDSNEKIKCIAPDGSVTTVSGGTAGDLFSELALPTGVTSLVALPNGHLWASYQSLVSDLDVSTRTLTPLLTHPAVAELSMSPSGAVYSVTTQIIALLGSGVVVPKSPPLNFAGSSALSLSARDDNTFDVLLSSGQIIRVSIAADGTTVQTLIAGVAQPLFSKPPQHDGACATAVLSAPSRLRRLLNGDLIFLDQQRVRLVHDPLQADCTVSTWIGADDPLHVTFTAGALPGGLLTPSDLAVTSGGDVVLIDAGARVVARLRPP